MHRGVEFLEEFKKLNISEVVIPEFEAGLEMARKALVHLHIPAAKIQHTLNPCDRICLPLSSVKMKRMKS